MKGIELSKAFYEQIGRPMLEQRFSSCLDRIAVGLVGQGSECFGYDDSISTDHDNGPGFCIWLTNSDATRFGDSLSETYRALNKEFAGYRLNQKSFGAEKRHGVFTIQEFYQGLIGLPGAPESWQQWFYLPAYALSTAVNGQVFVDPVGEFSAVRSILQKGYPRDVKLKKLSAHLALMAQSGQYNFDRCLKHGELGAAKMAIFEFVSNGLKALFILHNRYAPFYKWQFRALGEIPSYLGLKQDLERLLQTNDEIECRRLVDKICAHIVELLKYHGLTAVDELYLERQAIAVLEQIRDPEIRQLHLMENGE